MATAKKDANNPPPRQGVNNELEVLALILESNPIMRDRVVAMLRQAKERMENRARD